MLRWHPDSASNRALTILGRTAFCDMQPHRFFGLASPLSMEFLEPRAGRALKDKGPPPSKSTPPVPPAGPP